MITIDKIKTILFPDTVSQNRFIDQTSHCSEDIPGDTFDEKLHFLLHNASEHAVQIVFAPFLREKVYQYLSAEETEFAQDTKQKYVEREGELLFDEQLTHHLNDEHPNTAIYQSFLRLYQHFVSTRGNQIWNEILQSNNLSNADDDAQLYAELKQQFSERFPQSDFANNLSLWDRIHTASPATQAFDAFRQTYIRAWGLEKWAKNHNLYYNYKPILSAIPEDAEEQEIEQEAELGFPKTPRASDDYISQKSTFIRRYGESAWHKAIDQLIVSNEAQQYAHELKTQFIKECGRRQWSRIYAPPPLIAAFDAMKNGFIKSRGRAAWGIYSTATSANGLDPVIMADFKERKKSFDQYCIQQNIPIELSWEQARAFPEIPPASLAEIHRLKDIFVKKWGEMPWFDYLNMHRINGEYAEDNQLNTLGEIFDLRIEHTVITDGVERGTSSLHNLGEQTIHFFCADNIHWYVHDNGYSSTFGDGNCGYNGFAQWLKFLITGQSPRREKVLRTSDNTEISIAGILVELSAPLHDSPDIAAAFLQDKASDLVQIIRAKKLPYNRVVIIERISKLAAQFGQENKEAELQILQNTLVQIANTVYIPNTRGVCPEWTREAFAINIQGLQAYATTELPAEPFQDLGTIIATTNFDNYDHENMLWRFLTPTRFSAPSFSRYHAQSRIRIAKEEEEDWLSAILCIAGIFIIISNIICLTSLLLCAITMGPTQLGIVLMQYGLQAIATQLGAALGLSAPHAAVLVASTATTMLTGLGLSLFKDYAPPAMLAMPPLSTMFKTGIF